MSKGKGRPGFGPARGAFRPPAPAGGGGGMMAQLQKLQDEMAKTQERLEEETVEVTAGGGTVKAVMNGHQKLISITIAPEVVDPEDVEMLQDLVLAAINEAIEKAQALAAERMNALTGGLNIPGLT